VPLEQLEVAASAGAAAEDPAVRTKIFGVDEDGEI